VIPQTPGALTPRGWIQDDSDPSQGVISRTGFDLFIKLRLRNLPA
jgi:hypothetical protein